MMLDNTVVNTNEVQAAKTRFYNICERIEWLEEEALKDPDAPVEEKENTAYLDFSYLFKDILHILSDVLFRFFGGAGFSDM